MRALAALLLLAAPAALAQPGDWRTLTPAAGVSVPLGGGFGPAWDTGTGFVLRIESPAYGGQARASLRAARVEPRESGLPAFDALFPSLGWGAGLGLPGGLRLQGGPQLGTAYLRFEATDDFGGALQNETELTVGAWARVEAPVGGRVRAWAEAEAIRVALRDPVTLTAASAGLALRLDTPRWLRTVLR